ncbi:MAG: capsule biosynthesis protein CapK [Janthinobacterium lividum]
MDARIDDPADADRHPTLTEAGRVMLRRLAEHEAAPIYRNHSGSRLTADDLADVARFERETLAAGVDWRPGRVPGWVAPLIARAHAEVPHYRALGSAPARLADVAPVSRADLAADIAAFVPDDVPTERFVNYRTTGTTGHPLLVASHPVVAARYLAFHKRALARVGVVLRAGASEVGVVLLGYQRRCFTYVSVTPSMGESGLAKINLHPADWNDPADRARYLDALAPEIVAGDPISFAALLDLPVAIRPRALLSVSMMLTAGLREQLEARFGCPVLDLYSMNEVGPIGVADAGAGGHVLLQPRLYVEIVGPEGRTLTPGTRGEVCVTGGFNFCLPLLRYRTGDHASLGCVAGEPVLVGLSGRRPVRFRTIAGDWVNNIDVSHALQPLATAQFALHQDAFGAVTLRLSSHALYLADEAVRLLSALFGDLPVSVAAIAQEDKVLQYTSDLPGALQ